MNFLIYFLILCLYLITPILGEEMTSSIKSQFTFDFNELVFAHSIYVAIILIFVVLGYQQVKFGKRNWRIDVSNSARSEMWLKRIILVLIICSVLTFYFSGLPMLRGSDRGIIRVSLGYFGWLFTFIIGYLTPTMVCLSSVLYLFFSEKTKKQFRLYLVSIILTLLIALMTGYKAIVISIFFPAIIQVSQLIKRRYAFIIGGFGIVAMATVGMLTMKMGFRESTRYLQNRATVLNSEGTIGAWNSFPHGASRPYLTLLEGFGTNISSKISGVNKNSVEYLDYSLARRITYDYYPDKKGTLAGTVNLTVSSFGEAVFWVGRKWYPVFALFIGFIAYLLTYLIYRSRSTPDHLIPNMMYTTYLFSVLIVYFNSATIVSLFSLYVIFYMSLLYLCLRIILTPRIYTFRFS